MEDSMTTNNSSPEMMDFTAETLLDKEMLAQLLPSEPRAVFLAGCAHVERNLTRECAEHGGCLESGCALEGESCLNAVLNAAAEYNSECGRLWLPLFRSSDHTA
jgi:hypothetical protein